MNYIHLYALLLMFVFCTFCKAQNQTDLPPDTIQSESKEAISSHGPTTSVRTIKQDRKGNMWLASWGYEFSFESNQKAYGKKYFSNGCYNAQT
jgi:hypothetical protein